MAISFVNDWHQAHAEVATYDVPVPAAGVAQGHTIICSTVCSTTSISGVAITDDKGNSYALRESSEDASNVVGVAVLSGYMNTALVNGDELHVVLTGHIGGDFYFSEWSGLAAASFDKSSPGATPFDNTYTSGATATTTSSNELLFGAVGTRHPPLTITPDSPWDELQNIDNGTDCMHVVQSRIVSATGAYAATGTINVDTASVAVIATFAADDAEAGFVWLGTL